MVDGLLNKCIRRYFFSLEPKKQESKKEIITPDLRLQYDCQSYKQLSKEWGFQHITSSPRYPQSNGFIERQVQTVKNTLDKAVKSGEDPHMSMFCLRSTPIESQLPFPCWITYYTAARLAQLGERRSAEREVASSNPGRTNTQGLKITEEKVLSL